MRLWSRRVAAARTAAIAVALGAGLVGSPVTAPGAAAETFAVRGATVHPVSSLAIDNGTVLVKDGRIVSVGEAGSVSVPSGAEVIDGTGLHLWPGLIDAMSRLGLMEIGSVLGTRDHTELGDMNPNARAEVALNASSSHLGVTRSNGILLAASVPYGRLVPGTSAAIALEGWTWEELVRLAPLGLNIEWPDMPAGRPKDDPKDKKDDDKPTWEDKVVALDEMIAEAVAYGEAIAEDPASRGRDVRWEALQTVISGETPVWIHATSIPQIRAALDWTARHGLRMVLVDGTSATCGDAWQLAAELKARGIPVIVKTTRRPARNYEPYDTPYRAPARLAEAGLPLAFGSWTSAHARRLPQEAARAVAYGLPRADAERALTLGAAEIFGIDDRYGSLEAGKSATMILVRGDLLETRMNVEAAWIDGAALDLD
ncbi:MAG: amidohydrolase family protein, partial [Gemmatimonadetes bacterium]|nr:amidohydrolase family protein [Gemmatimonadota bacterium]